MKPLILTTWTRRSLKKKTLRISLNPARINKSTEQTCQSASFYCGMVWLINKELAIQERHRSNSREFQLWLYVDHESTLPQRVQTILTPSNYDDLEISECSSKIFADKKLQWLMASQKGWFRSLKRLNGCCLNEIQLLFKTFFVLSDLRMKLFQKEESLILLEI